MVLQWRKEATYLPVELAGEASRSLGTFLLFLDRKSIRVRMPSLDLHMQGFISIKSQCINETISPDLAVLNFRHPHRQPPCRYRPSS